MAYGSNIQESSPQQQHKLYVGILTSHKFFLNWLACRTLPGHKNALDIAWTKPSLRVVAADYHLMGIITMGVHHTPISHGFSYRPRLIKRLLSLNLYLHEVHQVN